jgi:hypothetical protein
MKCFTHTQADAVGQCPQCQKGICAQCAQDVGGLCPSCFRAGLGEELSHARHSIVGVWIFTGIATVIATCAAISSYGVGGIVYAPLAFAASWCFFWGWSTVWNWFRRQGFWVAGSWFVVLIVIGLAFELLILVAIAIGAFTGIKKYREARWVIANANRLLDGLSSIPAQEMPGTQGNVA